ncbi:MAG TPA: hypothetical protein VJH97_06870 [Candidatus Nanoarchaeia archaeon]|nr:hypothetical protein [Candidatus Nanoarchaeia archaeon]
MNQLELNVMRSFRKAKSDIIQLQNQVIELNQQQETLLKSISGYKSTEARLTEKISALSARFKMVESKKPVIVQQTVEKRVAAKRIIIKAAKKKFVASKSGKKFHTPNCIFAQNIKPKMKVIFKSKAAMLNQGYKPCQCIK